MLPPGGTRPAPRHHPPPASPQSRSGLGADNPEAPFRVLLAVPGVGQVSGAILDPLLLRPCQLPTFWTWAWSQGPLSAPTLCRMDPEPSVFPKGWYGACSSAERG